MRNAHLATCEGFVRGVTMNPDGRRAISCGDDKAGMLRRPHFLSSANQTEATQKGSIGVATTM